MKRALSYFVTMCDDIAEQTLATDGKRYLQSGLHLQCFSKFMGNVSVQVLPLLKQMFGSN